MDIVLKKLVAVLGSGRFVDGRPDTFPFGWPANFILLKVIEAGSAIEAAEPILKNK